MSTQSTTEPSLSTPLRLAHHATQRRRREMALTARWLRELRGVSAASSDAPRPTARFTRPAEAEH